MQRFIGFLLLAVIVALFAARLFLFEPLSVPSTAMSPTLNEKDIFLLSLRAYRDAEPRRGDIVVFDVPSRRERYALRIVGMPGDTVQMRGGVLTINGAAVPQEANGTVVIGKATYRRLTETLPDGARYDVLDKGANYVFDDTRPMKVADGQYFVLGDNRDNAVDSRDLRNFGLVPASEITGRAVYRIWDAQGGHPDASSVR